MDEVAGCCLWMTQRQEAVLKHTWPVTSSARAWFSPSVKWAPSSQADSTIVKDQEKEWPDLTFSK